MMLLLYIIYYTYMTDSRTIPHRSREDRPPGRPLAPSFLGSFSSFHGSQHYMMEMPFSQSCNSGSRIVTVRNGNSNGNGSGVVVILGSNIRSSVLIVQL